MIVAVASGKGGVGKTTVALEMAKALSAKHSVGLFDVDVTGANTHLSLEIVEEFDVTKKNVLVPAKAMIGDAEIEYMSIALVSDSYVMWKGDSVGDFVEQVLNNTKWSCDILILDTPPGSHSDAVRAMKQSDVIVLVTIPAKFAEIDLKRTVELIKDIEKPIAGVYLNFAEAICPHCGEKIKLFDYEVDLGLPVIQRIPFNRIEIDADKLLKHLNNPVKLKPDRKKIPAKIKREAIKLILKGFSRYA